MATNDNSSSDPFNSLTKANFSSWLSFNKIKLKNEKIAEAWNYLENNLGEDIIKQLIKDNAEGLGNLGLPLVIVTALKKWAGLAPQQQKQGPQQAFIREIFKKIENLENRMDVLTSMLVTSANSQVYFKKILRNLYKFEPNECTFLGKDESNQSSSLSSQGVVQL